jgi:hypothetical protein
MRLRILLLLLPVLEFDELLEELLEDFRRLIALPAVL